MTATELGILFFGIAAAYVSWEVVHLWSRDG